MNKADEHKVQQVRDLVRVKYVLKDKNKGYELMLKLNAKQQLRRIQGRKFQRLF